MEKEEVEKEEMEEMEAKKELVGEDTVEKEEI